MSSEKNQNMNHTHMNHTYISEVGGRECEPAPPRNREIVSFRSCVRARGVCDVISERKSPPCRLYLLSLAVGARIFYLLEIFYL